MSDPGSVTAATAGGPNGEIADCGLNAASLTAMLTKSRQCADKEAQSVTKSAASGSDPGGSGGKAANKSSPPLSDAKADASGADAIKTEKGGNAKASESDEATAGNGVSAGNETGAKTNGAKAAKSGDSVKAADAKADVGGKADIKATAEGLGTQSNDLKTKPGQETASATESVADKTDSKTENVTDSKAKHVKNATVTGPKTKEKSDKSDAVVKKNKREKGRTASNPLLAVVMPPGEVSQAEKKPRRKKKTKSMGSRLAGIMDKMKIGAASNAPVPRPGRRKLRKKGSSGKLKLPVGLMGLIGGGAKDDTPGKAPGNAADAVKKRKKKPLFKRTGTAPSMLRMLQSAPEMPSKAGNAAGGKFKKGPPGFSATVGGRIPGVATLGSAKAGTQSSTMPMRATSGVLPLRKGRGVRSGVRKAPKGLAGLIGKGRGGIKGKVPLGLASLIGGERRPGVKKTRTSGDQNGSEQTPQTTADGKTDTTEQPKEQHLKSTEEAMEKQDLVHLTLSRPKGKNRRSKSKPRRVRVCAPKIMSRFFLFFFVWAHLSVVFCAVFDFFFVDFGTFVFCNCRPGLMWSAARSMH